MASAPATVARQNEVLVFTGTLDRGTVPALWRTVVPLITGIRRLQLAAVASVDSAGVALLAEIAARNPGLAVDGAPAGLGELRAAYRLSPDLGFGA